MNSQILKTKLFCTLLVVFVFGACRQDPKPAKVEQKIATVNSRLRADPDKLFPPITTFSASLQVLRLIHPTLVEFDPWTLELVPMMAKKLPEMVVVEEGPYAGKTAFDYEILEEAVWDDGSPVTGHDYAFTLKVINNPHIPAAAYRGLLNFIMDVEVNQQNPKKFRVITRKPFISSEYYSGGYFTLQKGFYDKDGLMDHLELKDLLDAERAKGLAQSDEKLRTFADLMADARFSREPEFVSGCGAYRLEEWVTGDRLVLKKKENWWGDKLASKNVLLTARPDVITFRPISDASTAINLLKDGGLDILFQLPNKKFLELRDNDMVTAKYDLHNPPTSIYNFLGLNTRSPKLNDKRVRRALAHLMDMDEVIKTVKQGMATPISSPVVPLSKNYNKKLKPIKLDIERARQLLAEAGWTDSNGNGVVDKKINGQLVEMNLKFLITPNNEVTNSVLLIFKENAKKAGVNIEADVKENKLVMQNLKKRDFEIYSRAAAPDMTYYDPYQYWHTASDKPGGSNYVGFGNAESDALIEELRATLDEEKRREMYFRFQQMVYDEQPMIFLYNTQDCVAMSKRLSHAKPSSKYPGIFENFYGND